MEPAPQPQPLPEAKPFQKVVLFIGDTGVGKSKILNSVLNQGVSRKDLAGPAEVGNATTGTTERISYYYRQDLVLADTAGFFDRKISTPKVKQEFIDFVLRLNIGINHFYFVLKHGKIKVSDVPTFTLLEYMFGSKVYKQATLIVTHVDEQSYTLDQYLELNKDDAELRSFIDKFNGRVILGSFMSHAQPILDNVMAQTVREPFYRAIKADLDQCSSTKLEMRVINFNAFCQKLALLFGSVFGSPTEKRRLERLYEKERFKVHEHDSICLELVLNDIYITQCQHVFHFDCISAWIAQGKDTCPNCRQPLREFVCWRKSEGDKEGSSDQKKQ